MESSVALAHLAWFFSVGSHQLPRPSEGGDELVEVPDGVVRGLGALGLVLQRRLERRLLDGLEEVLRDPLLLRRAGQAPHGPPRLVHVPRQLVLHVEPLLLVDVAGELRETLLRFREVLLLPRGSLRVRRFLVPRTAP